MKRKILFTVTILILLAAAGIIYLNNVILPIRIKAIIVKSIEEQTQKRVSLESVQFSIFKGLVLRELAIYDGQKRVLSLKEGSCTFLIWPVFKRAIIIPNIKLRSPEILLERRKDNTFNLEDFLQVKPQAANPPKFNILVYKVSVIDGNILFKDSSLPREFSKNLGHLNLNLNLSLPLKVKFNLKSQIEGARAIKLNASGEYLIGEQTLTSKIYVRDFSPREFSAYYQGTGIDVARGLIDAAIDLKIKDATAYADISAKTAGMEIAKDKNTARINADIDSRIEYGLIDKQVIKLESSVKISEASINFPNLSFSNINGMVEAARDELKWQGLNFEYLKTQYKTEGKLAGFHSPRLELQVSSKELFLNSDLAIKGKLIELTQLSGNYLGSRFTLKGSIDCSDANRLGSDIAGELNLDLKDAKEIFRESAKQLEEIKPQGMINARVSLSGVINDLKSADILAKLSSNNLWLYGLKAKDFQLDYNQSGGIADIPFIRLSLYDGILEGRASLNLNSANLPYWINANIEGLKLQELKYDTAAKDKDIAGTLSGEVKLNGFSNDASKLSGTGSILVKEGKLWSLNLFRGLGSLLFARDFANIVFSEASLGFTVRDGYVFSDDIRMKSNITDLTGSAKIGFDSSIDASVNVDVIGAMAPVSGTFKDLTTAIIGEGGRFGVIRITGTLKEPKYKFKPAVADIFKGLRKAIFGE